MEDVKELRYARYVGHLGDMGGVGDMRDIELGIGTCLTVFLKKVTDWLTYLLTYLVTEQIIEMLSHLKIVQKYIHCGAIMFN